MVRERRELGRRIVAMELLHDGADARVQPYPVGRRELLVECLANQCVCETIPTRADRLADDDLACQRGAERLEERVTVDAARSLQDREVELTPDHRCERQRFPARRRQRTDASANRLADALRNGKLLWTCLRHALD